MPRNPPMCCVTGCGATPKKNKAGEYNDFCRTCYPRVPWQIRDALKKPFHCKATRLNLLMRGIKYVVDLRKAEKQWKKKKHERSA